MSRGETTELGYNNRVIELVNGAIFLLAKSGSLSRIGYYTEGERENVLAHLEKLTRTIRAGGDCTVVDGEHSEKPGTMEGGVLPS